MASRTTSPFLQLALILFVFFAAFSPGRLTVTGQGGGTIEGIVVRAGSSQPLSNAQVTLSGGGVSSATLEKSMEDLNVTANVPPVAWMNSISNYYNEVKGMNPQTAGQTRDKIASGGLPPGPENGQFEDEVFARMMNYSNLNFGNSPYSPEFGTSLKKFRAANAKYKMVTDGSGRFVFRDVPPGQYTVRVERDGYFGKSGSNVVPQTGSATVRVATGTTTVEIPMTPGATISGRLRNERGLPMANAMVQAFTVVYTNGLPGLRAAAANKTNDRGEYSIFWLPGGEYYIGMTQASTQVVNGSLLQQVVGTFYPGTPAVTEAVTVNLKTGDNLTGIDFEHRPVKAVKISGTVSTTLPVPAQQQAQLAAAAARGGLINPTRPAVLMLMQRDPNAPDDVGARTVGNVPISMTSSTGTFEVEVTPGAYDLYGRMPNPGGATNVSFGRVSFNVRDQDIKGLQITIAPPPPVSGSLTVNGAPPGQTNIKLSVQVDDSAAKLPAYGIQVRSRLNAVNPDGSFAIPGVLFGHWQLYIEGLSPGMYVADVRLGGQSIFDSGFDVTGEPLPPMQVVVRNDGATVQGLALDGDKKPAAKASVVLVPPENRRQNRQLYFPATADENGRFTITGVAPGTYKLFAWSGAGNFMSPPRAGAYFNPKYLARYESFSRSVSVGQGAPPTVEITLPPID